MKRMLKKLSAIALAGAMVLTLSVAALATAGVDGVPTLAETTASAQGQATGSGYTTGKIPDDVIKVKLPLNAAAGTFDLRLDPHNLIRQSNNATQIGGSSEVVFAADTLAYFKNSENDVISFSGTSDPIKVINKSNVPITVGMTAKWHKQTGKYALANSADDLAALKAKGEAALYLYLAENHTNQTSPVVEADKGTPVITWDYVKKTTGGNNEASITKGDLTYLDKCIKSITFEYLEGAEAQDIKNINEGTPDTTGSALTSNAKTPAEWNLAVVAPTSTTGSNIKLPTFSFSNVGTIISGYKTVNSSGTITTTAYKLASQTTTGQPEIIVTTDIDNNKTYAMKDGAAPVSSLTIQRGSSNIAKISIEWDYEVLGAHQSAVTEAVTKTVSTDEKTDTFEIKLTAAPGTGASLKTDLNTPEGAYQLVQKGATGADAEKFKWDTVEGFSYNEEDDDKWESVSFRLTAAITDGDVCAKAWDDAFGDTVTGTQLELVWEVSSCEAVDPSATVTTALASDTGTAVLKVDWGYGTAKTSAISAASFVVGSNTQMLNVDTDVAISGSSVSITSTPALYNGANGVITLTFVNPDTGYSKDVTVDLMTAS